MTHELAAIGLVGRGVIGENLALNIHHHGHRVALWTHTTGKGHRFIEASARAAHPLTGAAMLKEFVAASVQGSCKPTGGI